jgi:hypothetical protein
VDRLARPQFDGPVEPLRSGTVGSFEDLSIGVAGVGHEGANIEIFGHGKNTMLRLKIGEAGESQGVCLRLCAVWVDPTVREDSPPGSDASMAYYVIGRGSAPDCPGQITTND